MTGLNDWHTKACQQAEASLTLPPIEDARQHTHVKSRITRLVRFGVIQAFKPGPLFIRDASIIFPAGGQRQSDLLLILIAPAAHRQLASRKSVPSTPPELDSQISPCRYQ
jgi:hypothetical protein